MELNNINRLKAGDVDSLGDGMHSDGGYLWLRVRGSSRSWIVRGPRIDGRKPELALGSADRVGLAVARKRRDEALATWKAGKDPAAERKAAREAQANRKTFAVVAAMKIESKQSGWRPSFEGRTTTLDQWTRNIERDCAPIAGKPIDEISVDDIKRVVSPYWDRKALSAGRDMLKRVEQVFDYAIAHGWRAAANPAAWTVFKHLWPGELGGKVHRAALPWADAPAFLERLRASDAMGARVVEFVMLTAVRSGEARGALWSEIDLEARTWTVPASRLKTGKKNPFPHVVPLSDQAIELIDRLAADRVGDCLFPGYALTANEDGSRWRSRAAHVDTPIPNSSVWTLTKRMGGDVDITTHGFRSTFRDWAAEHGVNSDVAEACLAHIKGGVEGAYFRTTMVGQRRQAMQAWADFLEAGEASNVVPLKAVA